MLHRLIVFCTALALAALSIGACGAPDQTAQPAPAPAAVAPTAQLPQPTRQPGDELYVRGGEASKVGQLLVLSSAGTQLRALPLGAVAPDWSALYTTEYALTDGRAQTHVRAIDPQTGATTRETTLEGAYTLPSASLDGMPGGLSPDGRWLALWAAQPRTNAKTTQFAVVDTDFKQPPRLADLDGVFLFDGLNNSGTSLFLTKSLADDPAAKYQVRRYDLAGGALDPQVIVDKLEGSEVMSGVRQTAVASKDGGWLYSLYLNPDHGPFIHALPIADNQGIAFCIDLPTNNKDDLAQQSRWSLVVSGDQRMLYAVNGALGLVVEFGVGDGMPQLLREKALFEPPAKASDSAARQPTSTIAALAPDGTTLYTLGDQGLLVVDIKTMALRGRYLADWALDGLAISPDGARLYAASASAGKIVRLDPRAGTIVGEVPTDGRPAGVIRVES